MNAIAEVGTDLYQRMLAWSREEGERGKSLAEEWEPTPWIVDAYTGGHHNEMGREYDISQWCIEHCGPESVPMRGQKGQWKRGGATIDGYTWMGFATEEMMQQFCEAWL